MLKSLILKQKIKKIQMPPEIALAYHRHLKNAWSSVFNLFQCLVSESCWMQSLEDMLFLEIPLCSTEKTFLFPFTLLHIFSVMEAVSLFNMNKAL